MSDKSSPMMVSHDQHQAFVRGEFSYALRTSAKEQACRLDEIIERLFACGLQEDLMLAQDVPCSGVPQVTKLIVGDVVVAESAMEVRHSPGGSFELVSTIRVYPQGRPDGWPELGRPEDARGPCSCYERPRMATDIPCAEHGWLPPGVKLVRYKHEKLDLSKIPRTPIIKGEDDGD